VFVTGPPGPEKPGPLPQLPAQPCAMARGVVCVFRLPCLCPHHQLFPRQAPITTGGEKWGPVKGMSGDSPRTGAGQGLTPKYPPQPVVRDGSGECNPALPHPVTNTRHELIKVSTN